MTVTLNAKGRALLIRTNDNRTMTFFDGQTDEFHFKGKQGEWVEEDLQFTPKAVDANGNPFGIFWGRIDEVTASVFLSKIWNFEHAVHAGWGVYFRRHDDVNNEIQLTCRLQCSDNDGEIQKVGYHVVAIGTIG
jgi:hypothetical protein